MNTYINSRLWDSKRELIERNVEWRWMKYVVLSCGFLSQSSAFLPSGGYPCHACWLPGSVFRGEKCVATQYRNSWKMVFKHNIHWKFLYCRTIAEHLGFAEVQKFVDQLLMIVVKAIGEVPSVKEERCQSKSSTLALCRGRPPLKTIEDWYWVLSDGNTHPCPECSPQLSWLFSCEMAGRLKDGQVTWLKMANVNDTFEKISDGAGVHGVKQFEVLKRFGKKWNNIL